MNKIVLEIDAATATVIRNALSAAIIKAALDKNTAAKVAFERAKNEINAACVRALPSEPST